MIAFVPCDPARDGELIRELTRANFYEAMREVWNEARHQQEPKQPERYRMIQRDGETVGFFAIRTEADHLYVQTIQLVPEARGAGVGTFVMQHIRAQAQGVAAIRLRVLRANAGARRLYERLGYRVVTEEPTSVVMELAI